MHHQSHSFTDTPYVQGYYSFTEGIQLLNLYLYCFHFFNDLIFKSNLFCIIEINNIVHYKNSFDINLNKKRKRNLCCTGDVQEGDELEGDPGVPARGAHLRGLSQHLP